MAGEGTHGIAGARFSRLICFIPSFLFLVPVHLDAQNEIVEIENVQLARSLAAVVHPIGPQPWKLLLAAQSWLPACVLRSLAKCNQENGTFAFRVRREKLDNVVIVEREAGSTQVLRVGRQV